MARIAWVEDAEAQGQLAEIYAGWRTRSTTGQVPDIMRTMSLRPDFLAAMTQAVRLHFSDAQIAEAAYDGALFNLFVRLADAFDIHPLEVWEPDGVPAAVTQGPISE